MVVVVVVVVRKKYNLPDPAALLGGTQMIQRIIFLGAINPHYSFIIYFFALSFIFQGFDNFFLNGGGDENFQSRSFFGTRFGIMKTGKSQNVLLGPMGCQIK